MTHPGGAALNARGGGPGARTGVPQGVSALTLSPTEDHVMTGINIVLLGEPDPGPRAPRHPDRRRGGAVRAGDHPALAQRRRGPPGGDRLRRGRRLGQAGRGRRPRTSTKGRAVVVEGRLQLDQWAADGGERRARLKVVAQRVTFLPRGGAEAAVGDVADELAGGVPEGR